MSQNNLSKPKQNCGQRLLNFWFGPVDLIRIDTFRLLKGLSMLCYFGSWWRQGAVEWLSTESFHISAKANWTALSFPPLPVGLLPFFGIFFFGSLALWTLGIATRVTSWLSLLAVTYVTYTDILSAYTINKFYIVTLAVMALYPHGDYWTPQKRVPSPRSAWALRILQLTLIVHYFITGYSKAFTGDWLQNPSTLWSQIQGLYMTDAAAWMLRHFPIGVFSWMQYMTLTFELSAPLLFMVKRLRPIGMGWGLIFQGLVALTMHQLIFFSLEIICFYVLFLEDRTLHKTRLALKNLLNQLKSNLLELDNDLFTTLFRPK